MKANRLQPFLLTLCLTGCAYVGEPLYPALNIPTRIADLAVMQRGNNLDVYFTTPALTTEGLAIKQTGSIDLRVGPNKSEPFSTDQWAASATRISVPMQPTPGLVHVPIPLQAFVGQEVIVAVRITNQKGRPSEWSNPKTYEVKPPLAPPAGIMLEAVPEGVHLKWNATGEPSFRIYRKAQKELLASRLADSTEPQYTDATAQYGTRYEYWIQGLNGDIESELAGPFAIQPEDKFPPAVPSAVAANLGLQTIELAWERNTESDFKGYRVYRATGDAPFEKIADLVEAPTYSDNKIEAGKHYRYAVSSVDQSGNESEKSAPVEIIAP